MFKEIVPTMNAQGELDQRQSELIPVPIANNTQHPFDYIWQSSPEVPATIRSLDAFNHIWESSTLLPLDAFEHMWNISPSIHFSNNETTAFSEIYNSPIPGELRSH